MTKFATAAALIAVLGIAMPIIAQATPTTAQHDQLVQKINNAYGTQFRVHTSSVNTAASDSQARAGA